MPSLWSSRAGVFSTRRGSTGWERMVSVIVLSLLPFAALQSEPGDQNRAKQERDHGRSNRRALTQVSADDGTLVGERGHQVRGIDRPTARHGPDQLEVGEGE